jgi:hypothetical protein
MSEVPKEITGSFLQLCIDAHEWLVELGFAQATPESERDTMRVLAREFKDTVIRDEDGTRFYLVSGADAPPLH